MNTETPMGEMSAPVLAVAPVAASAATLRPAPAPVAAPVATAPVAAAPAVTAPVAPPRQPLTVRNLGNGGAAARAAAAEKAAAEAATAESLPAVVPAAPAASAPRPQQPPPLDATDARLRDTAKACLLAYRGWKQGPADASAQSLNEAVHELRKVLARIEIDMAASRRDEQVARPIPIPAHRASRPIQR